MYHGGGICFSSGEPSETLSREGKCGCGSGK